MAERSATPKATAWWAVRGLPNDSGEVTTCMVASRQPRASPADMAAMGMRAQVRKASASRYPWPSWPSRWWAGTRTPSKYSGWVSEERQPILGYLGPTVTPGASSGTRKAETGARPPPGALSRSWEAKRTTYFENGVPELVMNCLAPSMTQSVPSRRARVPMLPASDPPVGSGSPKAQKGSPGGMPGRDSARRASEAGGGDNAAGKAPARAGAASAGG